MAEIKKEHVLNAINKIESEKIELIPSTRWLLDVNGIKYPPKEVMRYAHEQLDGNKVWNKSGGKETNSRLEKMGFKIIEKISIPIKDLIEKYKNLVRSNGLKDELYKWKLLGEFKGKPDLNAKDFSQEIQSIDYENLIYKMGKAVIKHLAEERPEEYRMCFKSLFDEKIPLLDRINNFDKDTLTIYRQIVPDKKLSHHQDERTIATFLTFHNPDKYTFYKDAFYKEYCNLLGIKSRKKGNKYIHYLELVNNLIEEYINEDQELLEMISIIIPPDSFHDTNHKILAQDMLYQMFDKSNETEKIVGLMASDGTGWQDSHIEQLNKNDACIVQNTKLPSGTTDTIKLLRKIIKEENSFNLYYCISGYVNYKAKVIDFAINQDDLDKKKWDQQIENIYGYYKIFDDYTQNNKKKKRIIFLVNEIEKINPVSISDFQFYNSFMPPTQDNLSPISFEPINKIEINSSYSKKSKLKYQMNKSLNQILYGPPGTGKTYKTILKAAEIIEEKIIDDYTDALKIFKDNLHDRIEFITFHQNYSYEDFIQGLRPDTENEKELTFERKDGVFKIISDKALKNIKDSEKEEILKRPFEESFNIFIKPLVEGETEEIEVKMKKVSFFITEITNKSIYFRKASGGTAHSLSLATLKRMYDSEDILEIQGLSTYYSPLLEQLLVIGKEVGGTKVKTDRKNYVLIIDEINRANISRVFGELITLIEPDKRSHGAIPMEAKLPSGDTFIVPSNLYIIGTMNTADKSIALLDIALRRRFEFEAMYPKDEIKGHEIYDVDILKKINEQIIKLKGHDFQIGHSYFMNENNDLVKRMNNKVIPLLLEYFMNDKDEVAGILNNAGLEIEPESWPLRITGKKIG